MLRDPADATAGLTDDDQVYQWGHLPHSHPEPQFVGAVTGSAVITAGGQEFGIDPYWGVWLPAGLMHGARFDPGYVPLIRFGGPPGRCETVMIPVGSALRRALLVAGEGADPVDRLIEAAVVAARSGPRLVCPPVFGPLTAPIADALAADPADGRGVMDWALQLHSSGISVRRAFVVEAGMPFSLWRTLFRLNHAVALLAEGEPVAGVARAVGMSHNGLTLAFRRHLGEVPSTLRRR